MHSNFVMHRDIKPENIVVNADGVMKVRQFPHSRARMPVFQAPHGVTNCANRYAFHASQPPEIGRVTRWIFSLCLCVDAGLCAIQLCDFGLAINFYEAPQLTRVGTLARPFIPLSS